MHRLVAALVVAILATPAAHADSTYRMVSGDWRASGSLCQGAIEVEFRGTEKTGRLQWREGPMDSWKVGTVENVIPGFDRFFINSTDRSTSVQGTINAQRIEGSVTFYQRGCDYIFVLQRS